MTERKPHKWQKEIIAWANGEVVQYRDLRCAPTGVWRDDAEPSWHMDGTYEYRIKPVPVVKAFYCHFEIRPAYGPRISSWCFGADNKISNLRMTLTDGEVTAVELINREQGGAL